MVTDPFPAAPPTATGDRRLLGKPVATTLIADMSFNTYRVSTEMAEGEDSAKVRNYMMLVAYWYAVGIATLVLFAPTIVAQSPFLGQLWVVLTIVDDVVGR